jgi:hypothetical protein
VVESVEEIGSTALTSRSFFKFVLPAAVFEESVWVGDELAIGPDGQVATEAGHDIGS